MNDPGIESSQRLVAMLRAKEPQALACLFDAYADRLFRYCWFMLRNRDIAQIALRDALVVAAAHIGELADAKTLPSWLYALARGECRRRRPAPAAEADEPPARPNQPDADSRLMAWNAVTSMDAAEMEVLELACRHDVDLGLALGRPAVAVRALLDSARQGLEQALGAEILVSRGSHACPDRAEVMRGWAGTVTPELRGRVLRHASLCPVCGPNLPRNVSAARVFALLPVIPLPPDTRQRVLAFASDPRTSGYREFAVARAGDLASGFARAPGPTAPAVTVPNGRGSESKGQEGKAPGDSIWETGGRTRIGAVRAGGSRAERRPEPRRPRGRTLAAVGAVAAVAAASAVASVIVLGAPGGSRGTSRGHLPTAAGAGPSAPRQAGAGAVGALPAGLTPAAGPTAPPLLPRATASTGVTLFTLTKPLAGTPAIGPSLVPPQVPGGGPINVPSHSPAGTLTASPGTVTVGWGAQGQLVLTAAGGPQTWSAGTSSAQLTLSGYGGILQSGQSVTLVITVDRIGYGAGNALVYLDQGTAAAQTVKVFWSGRPPAPSPSATPAPSGSPSPSPPSSPSPSSSSGSSPPGPSASAPAPSPHASSSSPTPAPSPRYTPPPRYTPSPGLTPPPRPTQGPSSSPA
jgi:DNA-directed RNA polymerase specialized sigma24 family protein